MSGYKFKYDALNNAYVGIGNFEAQRISDFFESSQNVYNGAKLKWLNEDGFIKETPFTTSSTGTGNFGVNEGRMIDTGNERRHLIIQNNEDTDKIEKGKRFIFDKRAWKVTSFNGLIKGLIYLTVEETELDESDNLELGIANYYGYVANYSLTILNGEHFSIRAGTSIQLIAEVKNNGQIVNKNVTWTVSNTSIATVNSNGLLTTIANGEVTVTATLVDDPTVKDTTVVTVELENSNNYSVGIAESPIVRVNQSITFNAVVRNNNVVDPTKMVMWYLTDVDNSSPPLAATMTFNSTTQCTIKGLKTGIVHLKVVVVGVPNTYSIIPIQIKSLI